MYKNLYVSSDSNVKKINFNLRNKVSQRITRNGSDVIYHDFLPTPRSGNNVKSDKAQTQSSRHPLARILDR